MIKSDAQRDRTLAQIEGFRQALAKAAREKPGKRSVAIRGSYESMIRQLEDELHEYDHAMSVVPVLLEAKRQGKIRHIGITENPIVDFDNAIHPVGESWIFLRSSFLPYDDGLSLFVSVDGKAERQIRMQWRDEEQGPIIDHLADYVTFA